MSLLQLRSKNGKKRKKVIGRGNGSGHGTYSTKGGKGQTARSGGKRRPGFEGGQTPFIQKLPKLKGFKNPNKVDYQIINTGQLNVFDDNATVDTEALVKKNIVSKRSKPVKLLAGKGELTKSLTIKVHKVSKEALNQVEKLKGKVELLGKSVKKPKEVNA